MQEEYTNFWNNYLETLQRSWLEMGRLWAPAVLPRTEEGKGEGKALFPAADAWLNLFSPWMPKVEANIEPFMEEAVRVSMRIFMPWGNNPLWVEALVGKQDKEEKKKSLPGKPAKQAIPELEVEDAIKRSRTQD
ncbi:MAG: hypothetical protein LBB55_01990 [Zoogloeaceae bacterium]|jgi:hypothetical protein|nr:hypothetical protein [Zoogloeaceae bacterium]